MPGGDERSAACIDTASGGTRIDSEVSKRLDAQVSKAIAKVVADSEVRETKLAGFR